MFVSSRVLRAGALAVALSTTIAACGDDDNDDASDDDGGSEADAGSEPDAAPEADSGSESDAGADEFVSLPGKAFYPEGVTALADGTLFVGSVSEGTIVRVPPGAREPEAKPFAAPPDNGLLNTVGMLADEKSGTLWVCSSDFNQTGAEQPGVRAFDLATGEPAGAFVFPGGGFCNDVAVDGAGNVYATDSFAPRILRLPAGGKELEVWVENDLFAGEGFNLNGIEVDGDVVYTVKFNSGQLFQVPIGEDGAAGKVAEVALEEPLQSPDGMRLETSGTLLVVEGVNPGRLTRIALGGKAPEVTVVADGLDAPTTATVVGGDAWVVEGQLDHLLDPKQGAPELPFKVVRVPLQ
jgi:sugar lactone lactonase YvrE